MEIIKHGNKYEDRKLVCEKCGCEFAYDLDKDAYFKKLIDGIMLYVDCPECCNNIRCNNIRIGY